jgi:hypothetical protein
MSGIRGGVLERGDHFIGVDILIFITPDTTLELHDQELYVLRTVAISCTDFIDHLFK